MPLIHGFQATTVWKAFALNSIASALVILIAIMVKGKFDHYVDKDNKDVQHYTTLTGVILTLFFTFLASFASYTILYFVFGFGFGMESN
jgi:membrane-associated HD superfamily phosphohydrolase